VGAHGVRQLGALTVEHQSDAMEHHHALLLRSLDSDEAHCWPRYRFAYRLGIGRIVLSPFDMGLDVLRRHQPHVVAPRDQLARPVMGCVACLYPD
jgi:hypothetical protein